MLKMAGALIVLSIPVSSTSSFQSSLPLPSGSRFEARLPSPLFVLADSIDDAPVIMA